MPATTANVALLRKPVSLHVVPTRAQTDRATVVELPVAARSRSDATVAATALALLAVLSMFVVFASITGAVAVAAVCALVSLVLSVSTALVLLRRAGI
ncbi:hypothetical protein [Actinomyces sp.]|uniref:hypothetical protein n=1 Tax=Actinomyces sp. TaxID=29317 RepID=UPI0026DAB684|nr:hypothetical protein [Actinomyces sp.]MDO4901928.1 hypothetical protein [Actinomyces sp.]